MKNEKQTIKLIIILIFVLSLLSGLSSKAQKLGDSYIESIEKLKGQELLTDEKKEYKLIYTFGDFETEYMYKYIDGHCREIKISSTSYKILVDILLKNANGKIIRVNESEFLEINNLNYGSIYYKITERTINLGDEGQTYYTLTIW